MWSHKSRVMSPLDSHWLGAISHSTSHVSHCVPTKSEL